MKSKKLSLENFFLFLWNGMYVVSSTFSYFGLSVLLSFLYLILASFSIPDNPDVFTASLNNVMKYSQAFFYSVIDVSIMIILLLLLYEVFYVKQGSCMTGIRPLYMLLIRIALCIVFYLGTYYKFEGIENFITDGILINFLVLTVELFLFTELMVFFSKRSIFYKQPVRLVDYLKTLEKDTLVLICAKGAPAFVYEVSEVIEKELSCLCSCIQPGEVTTNHASMESCVAEDSTIRSNENYSSISGNEVCYLRIPVKSYKADKN